MKKFTLQCFTTLNLRHTVLVGLFLLCFFKINQVTAQGEANVWYFGEGLGLDFNSNPPTILENGNPALLSATGEGVGAISDPNGNLLFYTNGSEIYTRNHTTMPNGTGLNGSGTVIQTGLIVPVPGSTTQYYMISTSAGAAAKYVIVDMTLNTGLGDVVIASKAAGNGTVLVAASCSEGAVVVPEYSAANVPTGNYWLLFHHISTSDYYVFKITSAGITAHATQPVQAVGFAPPGQPVMMMKTNSCFDKIANAFYNAGRVEVLPFNNVTGVISAPTVTLSGTPAPFLSNEVYGVEFSPNGRFLYVTQAGLNNMRTVYQFDLTAGAVAASRMYFTAAAPINRFGGLQLGPDGKIYFPSFDYSPPTYINVIPNPDVKWTLTTPTVANAAEIEMGKYVFAGANSFGGGISTANVGEGLPPVLKNLLTQISIYYNNACEGGTTNFSYVFGGSASSTTWDFGDPASGVLNTSTSPTPSHVYSTAGTYTVTLTIIDNCGRTRTGTVSVIVKAGPTVSIPATLCQNTNITITGTGTNAANYTWSASPSMTSPSGPSSTYVYNGPLPYTFYVKDPTPLATYTVGNTAANANAGADVGHTYFELFTSVTIKSFQVTSRGSGSANFSLQTSTGGTTYWTSAAFAPGVSGVTQTFSPNITLGPGLYRFFTNNVSVCFRFNTDDDGGRDVNGVINVTGENSGTKGGSFFNIVLDLPDPCGVRAYTLTENCPLPVDWLSFTAKASGNKSHLNWILAQEKNNSHFIIQRSADAENYEDIGVIYGRGNSSVTTSYYYIDETPVLHNYYRLKQVDYDGSATYSKVEYVNFRNNGITVAPNPFNEELTITFSSEDAASIVVFDIAGRIVETAEKNAGDHSFVLGNALPAGAYVVQVKINDTIQTVLIVKE